MFHVGHPVKDCLNFSGKKNRLSPEGQADYFGFLQINILYEKITFLRKFK